MDPIVVVLVLVRWVHFCAIVALFGGGLFWAYAPAAASQARAATWRFGLRGLGFAAPVALATGAGWLAATIANMTGLEGLRDPDTLHAFFFETLFGPIEAARMALLAAVAILALAPMPGGPRVAIVTASSGLLLVSQAWLGHAAEGGATWFGAAMIAAYAAHVLAGAAWLGGLPPLLAWMIGLRRAAAPPGAGLPLLSRYSLMATFAVGLVLASGVANAAFRVRGRFGAFLGTDYGAVLAAKVALVALLLGFATYNRLVAMPRLRGHGGETANQAVATSIGCEIGLGVAVLAAAAVLGVTPPPG